MVVRRPIYLKDSVVPLDEDNLLGLRMTSAEFRALPECRIRYELMNGVVIAPPDTWGPLPEDANYFGLCMSAEDFRALPESSLRYELAHGVVIVSPSPSFWHQKIVYEIQRQLDDYLSDHPIGDFAADVDVTTRPDVTYRPDIVVLLHEKVENVSDRVNDIPDLVVEIVSPGSRGMDAVANFREYEAAGVQEYWLIDPQLGRMQFFALEQGRYREAAASESGFSSSVLPEFVLNLERIRRYF